MRGLKVAGLLLVLGAGTGIQGQVQQSADQQGSQPPVQTDGQKKPLKPNQLDPNGKLTDLPDPTKDPSKDPAKDPSTDPTKDSTAAADGQDAKGNLGGDATEAPDYTGPAILSRGYALSRPTLPVNQPFRFYAGVNAVYDSGVQGAYVLNGAIPSTSSGGADFNWGATMLRYRRKSIIDLNYAGHYYQYSGNVISGGQDHSLAVGYTQQITPRMTVGIRETAGLYSNTYSVLNSTAISDLSTASATIVVAPNTEAFNNRAYFSTTTGSISYQLTPRLSISANGAYFLVTRNSVDLADTRGYQVGADIAYRVTKKQTIGVYYSHSEFSYTKIFGDSNADSVGVNYAISLTRNMDLSFRGGGTRYDSQTLNTVIPNPLVQAVLGIQSGVEKFYIVSFAPDVTVTLNRKLRTSSVGVSFSEGITPGNGLVLTSKRQSESVFWSAPAFHKFATQVGGGHDNLSGYANGNGSAGSYASYFVRLSLSRPVTRVISSIMSFDYRQDAFNGTTYHSKEFRISAGFRWSPGEGPVRFW
jgi:hypothetical protein